MIRLLDISKTFGKVHAVTDASFEVAKGQVTALIGPSGSGKTTLLRMIGGLEEPDSGTILIDGNLANAPAILIPPYARGLGVVFQRPCLWPHMTVKKNIAFGLSSWKQSEADERTEELIHFTKLEGLENRLPHQLSGGEAQRVTLARAIAPNPVVLLLDEPFSNLDQVLRQEMVALIRSLRLKYNVTMLIVSHDHQSLNGLCDKVIALESGRVCSDG